MYLYADMYVRACICLCITLCKKCLFQFLRNACWKAALRNWQLRHHVDQAFFGIWTVFWTSAYMWGEYPKHTDSEQSDPCAIKKRTNLAPVLAL